MQNRRLVRLAVVTGCVMLAGLLGNRFVAGWNWGVFDFVFMGALVFGTGLVYELISRKGSVTAYRVAVGIACITGFLIVWINAAVGMIGDGPFNLLYLAVPSVAFAGALIARFQPRGMARAMFEAAVAQMLVPALALVLWRAGWPDLLVDAGSPHPPFHPGVAAVFGLNAVFAGLWVAAGLLFRHAGGQSPKSGDDQRGRGDRVGFAN